MSGYCTLCQMWHSGSCCHPARFITQPASMSPAVFHDPQVEKIRELEAVIEQQARDYAELKAAYKDLEVNYRCFVEVGMGMVMEEQGR